MNTGHKLAAISSVCKRAFVIFDVVSETWRVVADGIRTVSIIEANGWEGTTPEQAIENAWFWLTYNPAKGFGGRLVIPAEQQMIIIIQGKEDVWLKWDGFRWAEYLRQPSHQAY